MEISSKSIFVPWDFTEKADCAFMHALNLAKTFSKEIVLLNVVNRERFKAEIEPKLIEVSEKLKAENGINVNSLVVVGDLFRMIPRTAKTHDASLIIMGIHSSRRAIKTVMGSEVPFIIIQDKPKREKIIEVVVPIDYNDKSRVQFNWVTYLAKYFNSNINVIKPFINNNSKNQKMSANMHFARKILEAKNIVFGIKTAKRGEKWGYSISLFAREIDADLIFMMSHDFKKYMKTLEKEHLTIPIICLNPATGLRLLPDKY